MAKKIKDIDKIARDYANKEYPPMFEMPDDNWKQRAGYVKGFKAGAKWADKDKIKAKIDEIITALNERCDPDPLGDISQCLAAAQIEALSAIKDYINNEL